MGREVLKTENCPLSYWSNIPTKQKTSCQTFLLVTCSHLCIKSLWFIFYKIGIHKTLGIIRLVVWFAAAYGLMRLQPLVHCRLPWSQGSWGHHGAYPGPTGPRWAPCWPHELRYLSSCGFDHILILIDSWLIQILNHKISFSLLQ